MLNFIFGLKNHIVIIFQNERRIQMKFKEIEVGKSEQIRALLTGIEERGSKAGTRYLILNFTDGEQTVTANYWNCTREEFTAKEGQVLDLRVDAKLYKGSTSYTVQSYLLTDESPEASILHHVDCMDAEMYMFRSAREETKPGEMSDKIFALDCRVYNPKN